MKIPTSALALSIVARELGLAQPTPPPQTPKPKVGAAIPGQTARPEIWPEVTTLGERRRNVLGATPALTPAQAAKYRDQLDQAARELFKIAPHLEKRYDRRSLLLFISNDPRREQEMLAPQPTEAHWLYTRTLGLRGNDGLIFLSLFSKGQLDQPGVKGEVAALEMLSFELRNIGLQSPGLDNRELRPAGGAGAIHGDVARDLTAIRDADRKAGRSPVRIRELTDRVAEEHRLATEDIARDIATLESRGTPPDDGLMINLKALLMIHRDAFKRERASLPAPAKPKR